MDEIVREFLISGKIKFLEIGMHRYDVERYIPDLWEHLQRKSRGSSDFSPGALHLYFRRSFLATIRIYFSSELVKLPPQIYGPELIELYPRDYAAFTKYLDDEGISYAKLLDGDDQIELSIGPGVFVKFVWNKLSHIRRNPTTEEALDIESRAQATYLRKMISETKNDAGA